MKASNHLFNIFLTGLLSFLIISPFTFSNVSVDKHVLGISNEKTYYKRVLIDNSKVLIRTISTTPTQERDFLTITMPQGKTVSYLPLYEVANISDIIQSFSLSSTQNYLGNLTGKRISIKLDNKDEAILYDGIDQKNQEPINFSLSAGSKRQITLVLTSESDTADNTPITFDLLLNKNTTD